MCLALNIHFLTQTICLQSVSSALLFLLWFDLFTHHEKYVRNMMTMLRTYDAVIHSYTTQPVTQASAQAI